MQRKFVVGTAEAGDEMLLLGQSCRSGLYAILARTFKTKLASEREQLSL
jgi:hypothetical protein